MKNMGCWVLKKVRGKKVRSKRLVFMVNVHCSTEKHIFVPSILVLHSRKYVDLVKAKIVEAKNKGEGVWIEIR